MKGDRFKSPINGAFKAVAISDPGVNAWATEKSYAENSSPHFRLSPFKLLLLKSRHP
jgi:hypothetical protein